jgi:hypothetical protein
MKRQQGFCVFKLHCKCSRNKEYDLLRVTVTIEIAVVKKMQEQVPDLTRTKKWCDEFTHFLLMPQFSSRD